MSDFRIDSDENICFNCLTCATKDNHIVVWMEDDGSDKLKICSKVINKNSTDQTTNKLGIIDQDNYLLFLRPYCKLKDIYALAIENSKGTVIYLLNNKGEKIDEKELFMQEILIACFHNTDNMILFLYNYETSRLIVRTMSDDCSIIDAHYYDNLYTIPHVIVLDNFSYMLAWIDRDDNICYSMNDVYNDKLNKIRKIPNFSVQYLIGGKIDKNTVVYGGYDQINKTLHLHYIDFDNSSFYLVRSFHWKSNDYSFKSIYFSELEKGFLIMTDDSDNNVCYQRFTHIGSWLYPLIEIKSKEHCWAPQSSSSQASTLLVYTKDFHDSTHVYGKWLNIGKIPEIDDIVLSDLNL